MDDQITQFTLRVNSVLLDKLGYIAEYNGRTKTKEIEQLIKKHVAAFEKEQGEEINLSSLG
jgi:pyruvoyl-dependent arginine decarboxylase (PvlArgDC)